MLFDFRTFLVAVTLVSVSLVHVSESKIIHKAKLVRVYRDNAPVRTLPDGTRFEKYEETGKDLPPLPIGSQEEEADDLNDPRIGHLDKNGGIAVPVDENGKVLPGYEYLLKPITITIDLDEKDENGNPKFEIDALSPVDKPADRQTNYDPYPGLTQGGQSQKDQPSPPEDLETAGDEYDDVPNEPKESLPQVPDLPRPDYLDSGELDDETKVLDEEEEEDQERKEMGDAGRKKEIEVIVPSTLIERPIVTDNVEEKNKSSQDIEESVPEEQDKSIDIPKNRVDDVNEEERERENEEESIGLSDEDLEKLAEDIRKSVFEHVMNKASEFGGDNNEDSEDVPDLPINPESIAPKPSEPEVPSLPKLPSEDYDSDTDSGKSAESDVKSVDSDSGNSKSSGGSSEGYLLPGQTLSDEELEKIRIDSLEPEPELAPEKPSPPIIRPARFGPDSASQYNLFLQILTVSLAVLFL